MKHFIYFLFILMLLVSCQQNTSVQTKVSATTRQKQIIGSLTNSEEQLQKPYVLLISMDGFRYDYAKRYGAKNLLSFKVKAERMLPSFPSKTFPNHYALVSGLYPGHNGLVSNEFYDRKLDLTYEIRNRAMVESPAFYNGTPLWVLADQHQMVSASMFWVGSEAPIKQTYPTYYYKYNGKISHADRVNQVIEWLQLPEHKRPHFITLYFSKIDDLGHRYGPNSNEIKEGVLEMDSTIGALVQRVHQLNLPVNIIVVSDHGMLEVDNQQVIYLEDMLPKDMRVTPSFPAMVYSADSARIDSLYHVLKQDTTRYHVYLKNNIPKRFHYTKNLARIGDLVIMPKPPYTFGKRKHPIVKGNSTHGYEPHKSLAMGAIFYATGPAFKPTNLTTFENVHVYPLVAHILGLPYPADSIDGKLEVLKPILK